MTVTMGIATYFIMWWIVLFAVLPFGVHAQGEEGPVVDGSDPGAPTRPMMLVKAAWTTGISALLFVALVAYMQYAG